MYDPARDAWQKPKEVIQQLTITPASRVADLGAGGGYFTWHLADAVGPEGRVYAVEINETGLAIIKQEMGARGIMNVVPILAEPDDAKLPELVDLVFTCDTYHHMEDRVLYFRSLARYLKPGGRVAILDFHPHGFLPACSAMERPKKWSGAKWRQPAIGWQLIPSSSRANTSRSSSGQRIEPSTAGVHG
jgi:predicted methyltransferase